MKRSRMMTAVIGSSLRAMRALPASRAVVILRAGMAYGTASVGGLDLFGGTTQRHAIPNFFAADRTPDEAQRPGRVGRAFF